MISGSPPEPRDPSLPSSIASLLRLRASGVDRDRLALRLIDRTTETIATATYGDLLGRASFVAGELAARGIGPGDPAMLLMESRLEFYDALFGAMLAGALPVAVYPPASRRTFTASIDHLRRVASRLPARAILTSRPLYGVARQVRSTDAAVMVIDRTPKAPAQAWPGESVTADAPVMLQYTSGSLGEPRGVELSTRAVFANLTAIGTAFGVRDGDVGFSWLPLYHDMGLHSVIFGLIFRMPAVLLSPLEFLARPAAWLRGISRYGVTLSPAPTFGFSFAARRIADADLRGVDLSSWRVAMCGAEPIDPAALTRFAERFRPIGFRESALMAAYGLAENTVAVSFAPAGRGLRLHWIDGEELRAAGIAREKTGGSALPAVSVGRPIQGHDVRIVGASGIEVEDEVQGEIQVRGPSRMIGYRDDQPATRASFDGEWLLTGDLGYVHGGELFVTGRQKDLIIRGGRNYQPQDIERAATVEGVRVGGVVAFASANRSLATEEVVVVAEVKTPAALGDRRLIERIRQAVRDQIGISIGDVALVEAGVIPKTTSGKLRRAECRARWERGALVPSRPPPAGVLVRAGLFARIPVWLQRALERARTIVDRRS